jgi:hypothetical protein
MAAKLFWASALFLASVPVLAQNVFWVKTGVPGRQITGFQTFGCGDLNGDGYEDLFTVVDGRCPNGNGSTRGVLWFLSGRDGTLLREVVLPGVSPEVVGAASLGDMNGDGVRDYALLWLNQSGVPLDCEIRDGVTDQVLWSFPSNNGVLNQIVGDVDIDGDGLPDVVVCGQRNSQTNGELRAYSNSGTLLYQRFGNSGPRPDPNIFGIGSSLVSIGDVDGDGRDDFAMGCAVASGSGNGAIAIVSGATGTYLRVAFGDRPNDGLGFFLAAAGDMDGDGVRDVITGNGGTPATTRGLVQVVSSLTAQTLFQWTRAPAQQWGNSFDSRGVDLDGDGIGDVLVNDSGFFTGTNVQGAMHVYSGRNGSELMYWTGQPTAIAGSLSLARTLKPAVGQHIGYAVVGNALSSHVSNGICSHFGGSLVAYHGLPRSAVTLGPACPGTLTRTPNIGMSALGNAGVRIHLSSAPDNAFSFLLLGVSTTQYAGVALPAAMDPFGLPGCSLRTSIESIHTGVAGWSGTERGHLQLDLPLRVRAATLGGIRLSAQWLVLGLGQEFPGGMSQALSWVH